MATAGFFAVEADPEAIQQSALCLADLAARGIAGIPFIFAGVDDLFCLAAVKDPAFHCLPYGGVVLRRFCIVHDVPRKSRFYRFTYNGQVTVLQRQNYFCLPAVCCQLLRE